MAAEVTVPDLGGMDDVPVIEVHVAPGSVVAAEDPLVTLESDKATMDVPSPAAGRVQELRVAVGDRVSTGQLILLLEGNDAEPDGPADPGGPSFAGGDLREGTSDEVAAAGARSLADAEPASELAGGPAAPAVPAQASAPAPAPAQAPAPAPVPAQAPAPRSPEEAEAPARRAGAAPPAGFDGVHAGPGVRRLARELGVDLAGVPGSGPKGRITKEDLLASVRGPAQAAPAAAAPAGAGIPEVPPQDFSRYGPVEVQPLSRIQRLSGPHLHRSWLNVPHVTHDDDADITETDAYRRELDEQVRAEGYRVTLLAFLLKASAAALRAYPRFASSLTPEKDALVLKHYCHIGVAVDTPEGLVVPVLRDVDRKGIRELSRELAEVSERARDGKLTAADLQGGVFTISSLGGIGGTGFTPVVNAPEVAILGVVRSRMQPVWDGSAFVPRLVLPLCLSYDHRVIDGALAARFTRHLCTLLEDVRRLVL